MLFKVLLELLRASSTFLLRHRFPLRFLLESSSVLLAVPRSGFSSGFSPRSSPGSRDISEFAHERHGCQKVSPGTNGDRERNGRRRRGERRQSPIHKRGTRCHLGRSHREEEAPLRHRVPLPPSGRLSK